MCWYLTSSATCPISNFGAVLTSRELNRSRVCQTAMMRLERADAVVLRAQTLSQAARSARPIGTISAGCASSHPPSAPFVPGSTTATHTGTESGRNGTQEPEDLAGRHAARSAPSSVSFRLACPAVGKPVMARIPAVCLEKSPIRYVATHI